MYHSNKLLLVKTNMSGLYVSSLFTLHNVTPKIMFFMTCKSQGRDSQLQATLTGSEGGTYLLIGEERMLCFHCPVLL